MLQAIIAIDQTVDDFVDSLCADAIASAAVNHPYLAALNSGDFLNIELVFQDFALQYGLYSAEFTHYITAVIGNLTNPKHEKILRANLAEEQGEVEEFDLPADVLASIDGVAHANLYKRFQQAIGVAVDEDQSAHQCSASLNWSRRFLQLCAMNECVGVGAIGIGTELIVSRIYAQILGGLKAHSDLSITERVFFELHSQCDEDHAAQLLVIAKELGKNELARKQIEYGARMALDLRIAFWDEMLARAQLLATTDSTAVAKRTSLAH